MSKTINEIRNNYDRQIIKKKLELLIALLFIIVCGVYFITIGIKEVNTVQVITAIQAWAKDDWEIGGTPATNKIIIYMRFPRVAMAFFAGVGLSIAGAVMQSVMRNYLVSPFTLGISSASAFGASICIVFGSGLFFESDLGIIACAFTTAMLCIILVFGISKRVDLGPSSIVLVGIGLNYFFCAMTATIEFFAKEHKLAEIVQWSFGSFNKASWNEVFVVGVVITLCYLILTKSYLKLNVMSTGDDELVKSLGVNPNKIRRLTGFLAVLMTASIISFSGIIGFVGLIAPHIARILFGNDHRFMLPFAGVIGAFLLMAGDAIGRVILEPVIIPVGIIVSFIGVPLFIQLILSNRKKGLW